MFIKCVLSKNTNSTSSKPAVPLHIRVRNSRLSLGFSVLDTASWVPGVSVWPTLGAVTCPQGCRESGGGGSWRTASPNLLPTPYLYDVFAVQGIALSIPGVHTYWVFLEKLNSLHYLSAQIGVKVMEMEFSSKVSSKKDFQERYQYSGDFSGGAVLRLCSSKAGGCGFNP